MCFLLCGLHSFALMYICVLAMVPIRYRLSSPPPPFCVCAYVSLERRVFFERCVCACLHAGCMRVHKCFHVLHIPLHVCTEFQSPGGEGGFDIVDYLSML